MLNKRLLNIIGYVLLFLGFSMLFSAAWSYYYQENDAFVGDMTNEQFANIQDFFDTMPKLRHVFEFKNPKTKQKNEVLLERLADFFD